MQLTFEERDCYRIIVYATWNRLQTYFTRLKRQFRPQFSCHVYILLDKNILLCGNPVSQWKDQFKNDRNIINSIPSKQIYA